MSKIVAIDYGRKKIGVAVANSASNLAEPLSVIRFETREQALDILKKEFESLGVEKVIIGISEGSMAKETKEFAHELEKVIGFSVELQDETLTTRSAQDLSIQAGIKRKKRQALEDAYAAALILQSYLDQKVK